MTVIAAALLTGWALTTLLYGSRTIEVVVPPACVVLPALLTSPDSHTLNPRDETRLDTVRIQQALDHCAPGKSVRLSSLGTQQAFLSGPLQLRSGVTLVLEKGVVLFGTREARAYQVKQGSCGVVDEQGQGCRPLISGVHVAKAGLMGEGVLDGRGNAIILGETYSWWELADEARLTKGKVNAPGLLVLDNCPNFARDKVLLRGAADKPLHPHQAGR